MSAALKLELPSQPKLISVEEYLAAEEKAQHKHEYVGGEVYAMAGSRNVHNRVAMNFLARLHAMLRGKPCQPYNSDTKVRIQMPTHTRFYYPDGMVVCQPNGPNEVFNDRPVVIGEVLSKSTRRIDTREKREGYLTIPTLTDYLLIETEKALVTVYHRMPEGFVTQVYEGLEATLPLDSIGVKLPLAELYESIDFEAAKRDEAAEDDS